MYASQLHIIACANVDKPTLVRKLWIALIREASPDSVAAAAAAPSFRFDAVRAKIIELGREMELPNARVFPVGSRTPCERPSEAQGLTARAQTF
jgi:hypothetical protein